MPFYGAKFIGTTDPDAKVSIKAGEVCICPASPFECDWLDCRSDCKACKRRRAS
jgi:hypothetical protein